MAHLCSDKLFRGRHHYMPKGEDVNLKYSSKQDISVRIPLGLKATFYTRNDCPALGGKRRTITGHIPNFRRWWKKMKLKVGVSCSRFLFCVAKQDAGRAVRKCTACGSRTRGRAARCSSWTPTSCKARVCARPPPPLRSARAHKWTVRAGVRGSTSRPAATTYTASGRRTRFRRCA